MPSSLYPMIFSFCAITLFNFLQLSICGTNETDKLALLEIKAKIIHDPFNVMNSWNNSYHFCQWHGVSCNNQQRVVAMDLHSLKLQGSLSSQIGNLTFLTTLNLQDNMFSENIPSEIGHLQNLKNLLLTNNSFSGLIPPNISRCPSLVALRADGNKLVGNIPVEFGHFSHLQFLDLSKNNLTGTIPYSLGNLSSLRIFSVSENSLNGRIPESLGKLKNISILSLSSNMLYGRVPHSIFNLSFITKLDLKLNSLEGNLPSDLGFTLPFIQFFSIGKNSFTGLVPASISNASSLGYIGLSENKFQGSFPSLQKLENLTDLVIGDNNLGNGEATDLNFVSSLVNATMLQWLDIGPNNFGGALPRIICNFSTLTFLKIESNMISGQIPTCIGNLANLQVFDAWGNQLTGIIPEGIGMLQNLNELDLSINQLSGNIPESIGNLTMITDLQLSQNNLQGYIPLALGSCISLLGLTLSYNDLSGTIPSELLSLSMLSIALDLASNRLTGPLPEVGKLNNLAALDISGNRLSGEIPSSLSSCIALEILYLGENDFQGAVPNSLQALKGLLVLDLSQNNFSGEIPKFLVSLPLQMLNLSDNINLEGEVPIGGVFNNVSAISLFGNNRICGGIAELKLPKCNFGKLPTKRHSHRRRLTLAIIFGSVGVALLVIPMSIYYIFWYRKRTQEIKALDDSENFPNLSYQTLLKATDGFASRNLLGVGSVGVVYKGNLDDGMVVAVKTFKLEHPSAFKSFMDECRVLRNIRHRNLIKIVTACSSIDYQGNDFKALVYEYMINGSLEDWLHPAPEIQGTDHAPKSLSFSQRLNIAVDVAFALEYLHHHCGTSVVHCDLKPSNVLLDHDLVAHVSDFGLAKFLTKDIENSQQSNSTGVRGTIGYAPPEYGVGNEVSTYGDVYSFGILLLEMFTRKRPTNNMFEKGLSLRNFVEVALPDKVVEILDNALLEDIAKYENNSNVIFEALISVLGLALHCSSELPQKRLDMRDVAANLSSTKYKLSRIYSSYQS